MRKKQPQKPNPKENTHPTPLQKPKPEVPLETQPQMRKNNNPKTPTPKKTTTQPHPKKKEETPGFPKKYIVINKTPEAPSPKQLECSSAACAAEAAALQAAAATWGLLSRREQPPTCRFCSCFSYFLLCGFFFSLFLLLVSSFVFSSFCWGGGLLCDVGLLFLIFCCCDVGLTDFTSWGEGVLFFCWGGHLLCACFFLSGGVVERLSLTAPLPWLKNTSGAQLWL